ncbi:2-hydroxyhepta-2,4-diene-1,7-dioate isomerase [Parazoarcus communis]|uniref:2-hydroxyhepta-2,4-diene-1,7-dioate isomerase n=1 Tax=Parazoarcus communis TaxID=41977 RepID=A0A2U8GT79_9RHOO|nr:fumarylacetoacetate hydrolase family protein [Parazoarcus communis]AWI76610.1 2-hydroxyhepta-2,4-diene-1,7-dioate isomerase [Parazoarcus communis]
MTLKSSSPQTLPPQLGTVYGVVLNDHRSLARFGDALEAAPYKGAPKAPAMYVKPANTVVGDGATVHLPNGETAVEIGATVGIVIGRPAARLTAETALEAVAGYVLVADLSLPHASYYRPAIREKCFDGACPVATTTVSAAEAGRLADLKLTISVDGVAVGTRTFAELVRDVPRLLVDVTEFMTLSVGDVLLLGVEYQAPQARVGSSVHIEAGPLGTLGFNIQAATEAAQ